MKQIRISQLIGAALDWAVAQCMDIEVQLDDSGKLTFDRQQYPDIECDDTQHQFTLFSPSTLQGQGNPIIKRERIVLIDKPNGEWHGIKDTRIEDRHHWTENRFTNPKSRWRESPPDQFLFVYAAKEPLVAAMRSYVAAHYGDEIIVPHELLVIAGLL